MVNKPTKPSKPKLKKPREKAKSTAKPRKKATEETSKVKPAARKPLPAPVQIKTHSIADTIKMLARNSEDNKVSYIMYRDAKGHASRRRIEAYALKFSGNSLLLVAHCLMRGGIRTFELKKIQEVYTAQETFVPKQEITLLTDLVNVPSRFLV